MAGVKRRKRKLRAVHCAAVDLGATSGRIIVGTWSKGRLELTEVHRFPNQFHSLGSNDYWDLAGLWTEVRSGLVEAKAQFPDLASVGVDTWGVDHVLVDDAGRLVHPTYAYRDLRTQPGCARLEREAHARIYQATGIPAIFYNASLQLQETVAAFLGIADVAERCLFLPDYFNFLLSGQMENELAIASTSQLLDVSRRGWSAAALKYFGVPRRWFKQPSLSPKRLGNIKGIPELKGVQCVMVPGHDTACAFTAMPAAPDGGDLYLSSGTWSLLGFENSRPLLGKEALAQRVSNERMGDGTYRPLKSCLGLWLLEQTLPAFHARPRSGREWDHLIKSAARLPAPEKLLDVTDASLVNPKSMKAVIDAQLRRCGAKLPKDLPAYVRLICESLGRGHAEAVQTFERLAGRKFRRVLIVGGGSKNGLLCQATADACGLPVVSLQLEGSAVGNLAMQLIALGAVPCLTEFRRLLARQVESKMFVPHE